MRIQPITPAEPPLLDAYATPSDVAKAGQYLGVLLQNLAVAYDPACIVLGGPAMALDDALLAPVRATLQQYAQAARVARFGADAGVARVVTRR